MDIIIDTKGQPDLMTKNTLVESDDDDPEIEDIGLDTSKIIITKNASPEEQKVQSNKDIDLYEFENDMGWKVTGEKRQKHGASIKAMTKELAPISEILKKSAIKPGFEQLNAVPGYYESQKKLRVQRRIEREKTKGKKWFNLPATEMTDEIKHDLEVIQMRSVLDPKHFYKKNDVKALPKYFQIGKVMDSPIDYYNGRLTNKQRKKTIVDELMADAEFSKYNKRKYKEIIDEKRKMHYKAHRHSKKLKGKKK